MRFFFLPLLPHFPSVLFLLLLVFPAAHGVPWRSGGGRRQRGRLGCGAASFSPLLSRFTLDSGPTPGFSFHFLSASLLACMLSSVLLGLPTKTRVTDRERQGPCWYLAVMDKENRRHLVFTTRIKISARSFPFLFRGSPGSMAPSPVNCPSR